MREQVGLIRHRAAPADLGQRRPLRHKVAVRDLQMRGAKRGTLGGPGIQFSAAVATSVLKDAVWQPRHGPQPPTRAAAPSLSPLAALALLYTRCLAGTPQSCSIQYISALSYLRRKKGGGAQGGRGRS